MADEIKKKFIIEGDVESVNKALNELDVNLDSNSVKITEVTEKTQKLNEVQKISTEEITKNGGAMSILDMATGGMASQLKNAYEATKLFNISLKGTRTALIATGIGAFVVALGLIVAYWDDIIELITQANKKLETQLNTLGEIRTQLDYQLDINRMNQELAELEGRSREELVQTERKLLVAKKESLKNSIHLLEVQLQNEESKIREVTLLEQGLIGLKAYVLGYGNVADGIISATGLDVIWESRKKLDQLRKELLAVDISIAKIDNPPDEGGGDDGGGDEQKEMDETNALLLEGYEQREKDKKEFEDKLRKIEEENREIRLRALLGDEAFEISENHKKYAALLMQAEEFGYNEKELIEARERERLEIEKRYQDERDAIKREREEQEEIEKADKFLIDMENEELTFRERQELIDARREEINNNEKLSAEQKLEFLKEVSDAEIKLEEEKSNAKQMAADVASGLLSSMSSLLGENTAEGKAMAIAATTIDTIQSSIAAFKGTLKSVPAPAGMPLAVAAAAAAAVTGMAAVKKIVSVKVPGGKGGGGAPVMPSMQAPQFNVVGRSSTNQLADVMMDQNRNEEPIRAYVVSGEVTTGQNLDRNRIDNSTFL